MVSLARARASSRVVFWYSRPLSHQYARPTLGVVARQGGAHCSLGVGHATRRPCTSSASRSTTATGLPHVYLHSSLRALHTSATHFYSRPELWEQGDNAFGTRLDQSEELTSELETQTRNSTADAPFMMGGYDFELPPLREEFGPEALQDDAPDPSESLEPVAQHVTPKPAPKKRGRTRKTKPVQDQETSAEAEEELKSTRRKRKTSPPANNGDAEKMDESKEEQPKSVRQRRKSQAAAKEEGTEEQKVEDGDDEEMVFRVPKPKRKSRKHTGAKEVVKLADLPHHAQDSSGPLPSQYDQEHVMSPLGAETRAWAASLLPRELYALQHPPAAGWNQTAKDVLTNIVNHPGCILLTRLGSFYEAYMSQAHELARIANIRLAKINWRGHRVDMAGFPCIQLPKYIDLLVRKNHRLIALCDEFIVSPPTDGKPGRGATRGLGKYRGKPIDKSGLAGLVQVRKPLTPVTETSRLREDDSILRRVTEVISPGTLVDDSLVDPYVNNFLLAISAHPNNSTRSQSTGTTEETASDTSYGLAWLDLGTSTFSSTSCPNAATLRDEVARISPREIVLPDGVFGTPIRPPPPEPGPVDASGLPTFPPPPVGALGEELPYQRFDHPLWEVAGESRISFVSSAFAPNLSELSPTAGSTLEETEAIARLKDFLSHRFLYRPDGLGSILRPGDNLTQGDQDVFTYLAIPAAQRQDTDMRIDAHTLAALEVRRVARAPQELAKASTASVQSVAGQPSTNVPAPSGLRHIVPAGSSHVGSSGSLLHAVRRTITRGGARLLERWLVSPSTNIDEIQRRHDAVSFFLRHAFLSSDLRLLFKVSADVADVSTLGFRKKLGTNVPEVDQSQTLLEGLSGGADPIRAMIKFRTASSTPETLGHVLLFLRLVGSVRLAVFRAFPDAEARLKDDQTSLGGRKKPTDLDLAVDVVRNLDPLSHISSSLSQALILKAPSEENGEADEPAIDESLESDSEVPPAGSEDQAKDVKDKVDSGAGIPPLRLQLRPESFPALATLVEEYDQLRAKAMRMESVLRQRLLRPERRRLALRTIHRRGPVIWVDRVTSGMASALAQTGVAAPSSLPEEEAHWYTEPVHLSSRVRDASARTGAGNFMPWTELSADLANVRDAIRSTEDDLLTSLVERVWQVMPSLRSNAAVIDQLDVFLSFAALASERALVRPQLYVPPVDRRRQPKALPELDVRDLRHLVVEAALEKNSRAYTPNDVKLTGSVRAGVITGPNMGGKSTVLRAVAHAVLLAQAGSFVPATFARWGVVDGLFARVGARDALWNDQSTFMLEMLETAHFLTHATRNSLVIADEIGRGTAAETGLAIAHATLSHLTHHTGARTLFATHFHPIVALLGYPELLASATGHPAPTTEDASVSFPSVSAAMFPGANIEADPTVTFWCTDAHATPQGVVFDHRLKPGVNTNSYGLVVARLAGVPPQVVDKAQTTLDALMRPASSDSY